MIEEKIQITKPAKDTPKELLKSSNNTVTPPTPKQVIRRERKGTSALSLKSIHQKVETIQVSKEIEIDRNTLPTSPFTLQELTTLWDDYAQILIKKGDKSLASILMASKPTLINFKIKYALPNKLMGEQLEKLRPQLLKHLRDLLNNFSIDLEIVIEEIATKKFVYTPQEKFDKLKELNPAVEYLRSVFKLDI